MPRITVKIPNSYESITHQVANVVARDVMKVTDMDFDKTSLHILGEFQQNEHHGTKIGSSQDATFGGDSRLIVTVDDSLRNDSILNQFVRTNEHHPILYDKRLGIGMFPVYVDSDLTLTFKYYASSRTEAIKWRDEFAIRRAEDRTALYHEIFYYIPIQDSIFDMLAYFHELKEKVAGYYESFDDYIRRIQQRQLTTLKTLDQDINKASVAIPEKQAQITGYFDFSDVPKESKTDGNVTWEIEWSYKLLYKRCTHFYLVYPISIHQQHIKRQYFSSRKIYNLEELPKISGIAVRALDHMDGYVENFPDLLGGLRFPHYDDWAADYSAQPPYTEPQMTWLLSMDSTKKEIVDLNVIPDIQFEESVEQFMRAEHKNLTIKKNCLIHLTLWSDGRPLEDGVISVDENLKVRIERPLNLQHSYRLRFSLVNNRMGINDIGIDAAKKHPEATIRIFQTLLPRLPASDILDDLLGGTYLPSKTIDRIFAELERLNKAEGGKGVWIDGTSPKSEDNIMDGIDPNLGHGIGVHKPNPDSEKIGGYQPHRNWGRPTISRPKYVQIMSIITKRKTT